MLRDPLPPLAPSLPAFDKHFAKLHSAEDPTAAADAALLPPDVAAQLLAADLQPFTANEVCQALSAMQRGKSTGLGHYPVDVLRACHASLHDFLAELFTTFG